MSRCKKLGKRKPCFYCGIDATGYDHVTPFVVNGNSTDMVPACKECNNLLYSTVFKDVWDKKRFIRDRLLVKFKSLLTYRDFEPEELETLDRSLRIEIELMMQAKQIVKLRIEYASCSTVGADWLLSEPVFKKAHPRGSLSKNGKRAPRRFRPRR